MISAGATAALDDGRDDGRARDHHREPDQRPPATMAAPPEPRRDQEAHPVRHLAGWDPFQAEGAARLQSWAPGIVCDMGKRLRGPE
jgi:hypothetical protein